jgi:hypothetical protein
MRKIREVLRLRAEGFSEREIAQSVGCGRSSVQICLWRPQESRHHRIVDPPVHVNEPDRIEM